jgi:hypothetical protein
MPPLSVSWHQVRPRHLILLLVFSLADIQIPSPELLQYDPRLMNRSSTQLHDPVICGNYFGFIFAMRYAEYCLLIPRYGCRCVQRSPKRFRYVIFFSTSSLLTHTQLPTIRNPRDASRICSAKVQILHSGVSVPVPRGTVYRRNTWRRRGSSLPAPVCSTDGVRGARRAAVSGATDGFGGRHAASPPDRHTHSRYTLPHKHLPEHPSLTLFSAEMGRTSRAAVLKLQQEVNTVAKLGPSLFAASISPCCSDR